jgi:hypothetical protein
MVEIVEGEYVPLNHLYASSSHLFIQSCIYLVSQKYVLNISFIMI